jgi:uncharacterized protein YciI
MHFLLFYEFVPDFLQRRGQLRSEHLRLAWEFQGRGELILAGAYADPVDGAALLFKCDSSAVAERFVAADPYAIAGLVKSWRIREWTTVVGQDAITPVRAV